MVICARSRMFPLFEISLKLFKDDSERLEGRTDEANITQTESYVKNN